MKIDVCQNKWTLSDSQGIYICDARVPGCNYTDLLRAGFIGDPFADDNADVDWITRTQWNYSTSFEITPEIYDRSHIHIVFEQIDTLADIYINDSLLAVTDSVHLTYDLPIKDYLHIGVNELTVSFRPPFEYAAQLRDKYRLPNLSPAADDAIYVRKPAYHFGWTVTPSLYPVGLTRPVYIYTFDHNKIDHITIKQAHHRNNVYLNIRNSVFDETFQHTFEYLLTDPDGEVQTFLSAEDELEYVIENPRLWWCNGMGDQPLYTLECRLYEMGEMIDSRKFTLGLRNLAPYVANNEQNNAFCFKLNGYKLFARGANWIPSEYFITERTAEELEELISAAKKANFNMLRVWGGAYYECDLFYELCDRYGILVWQDLPFVCTAYPFRDPDFHRLVLDEIKQNVQRIRTHACLALLCGNVNMENTRIPHRNKKAVLDDTEKFFYQAVPRLLRAMDVLSLYTPTSPMGTHYRHKVRSISVGDSDFANVWMGAHRAQYFTTIQPLFCSWFGLASIPSLNALQSADATPIKTPTGRAVKTLKGIRLIPADVDRTKYYILDRFWKTKSFADYVFLSQLSQAEAAQNAVWHWRLHREKCFGALLAQYADCLNVLSCSSIDHELNYKALQYRAAHFFSPDALLIDRRGNEITIFLIVDSLIDKDVYMQFYVGYTDRETCQCHTALDRERRQHITPVAKFNVTNKNRRNLYLHARLTENMQLINAVTILPCGERKTILLPFEYHVDFAQEEGYALITLTTRYFARYVTLRLEGRRQPFSDNYFDMLPGETKMISVPLGDDTLDELKSRFSVTALNDVAKRGNRLTLSFARAAIRWKPDILKARISARIHRK